MLLCWGRARSGVPPPPPRQGPGLARQGPKSVAMQSVLDGDINLEDPIRAVLLFHIFQVGIAWHWESFAELLTCNDFLRAGITPTAGHDKLLVSVLWHDDFLRLIALSIDQDAHIVPRLFHLKGLPGASLVHKDLVLWVGNQKIRT